VKFTTYALASRLRASWMGEGNEVGQGFGKVLEVLGETPVSSEPGEGTLDHPAARQDDEAKPFMSSLRLTISPCAAAAPLPPQRQPATRCSRHQLRSIGARGSAVVSCRVPTRRRAPSASATAWCYRGPRMRSAPLAIIRHSSRMPSGIVG
jgi:hypothetical protein